MTNTEPTRSRGSWSKNSLNAKITGWTALSGVLTVVVTTVVGGFVVPGYSHASQFISELGARESIIEMPVRFGFLVAGLLLSVFAFLAYLHLPRSFVTACGLLGLLLYASGYTVAAFFPCDPGCRPADPSQSQLIHNLSGLVGYVASPLFLIAIGRGAKHWPRGEPLSHLARVAAVFAFAGLITLTPDSPYVGISQRLIEVSVLGWVAACACYFLTQLAQERRTEPVASSP